MPGIKQTPDQRPTNQPRGTRHPYPHRRSPLVALSASLRRALGSGAVASVLSTVMISWFSRHHSLASGTNATSHWLWGSTARRQHRVSLRHTAVGYVIHHASSVFWASLFEHCTRRRCKPADLWLGAAATAVVAYVVDYHVVPRRLNPGFESRLDRAGMLATYTAFAVGLGLAGMRRLPPARRGLPPVAGRK